MGQENYGRIIIAFDDMVEFHALKNGIDALLKEGIETDLFIPPCDIDRQPLLDETYNEIAKRGYSPIREIDESVKYKILLDPHARDYFFQPQMINHEFRIRYKYSLISGKPSPIYSVPQNFAYDAILCYTKREAEILSAHTKTYLISPMRYKGFKKDPRRPAGKPVLLYAPTFGKASSIDTIGKAIQVLREDYYIIMKAHHLTQHADKENHRIDILKNNSDEYYDQTADLVELLKRADVMLSDNSGAIFEAIYAEVPVAVYHHESLNNRSYKRIDTFQHQLAQRGVLPYTFDAEEIGAVLKKAMENKREQKAEKADFLPAKDVTKAFVDVMKLFLSQDRENSEYYAMHDIIRETYTQQLERIDSSEKENFALKEENDALVEKHSALEEEYLTFKEEAESAKQQLEKEIIGLVNEKSYKLGRALTSPYRALTKTRK